MKMHNGMKGIAAVALAFASAALCEELLLKRQSVPMANSFTLGDVVLNIENDSESPSGWTINAGMGAEVRRVHVTKNGVDFVYFPGKVLSVQNWGLAGRGRWILTRPTGESSWNGWRRTIQRYSIAVR